jgi:uroporphyrinogen-III synthase
MRRLIILRPEPGASASVSLARELGIDALAIPLFEIEPLEWEAPEAGGFDGLLLTSANAVRCAGDKLIALRGLKVYAVGDATAAAARQAGFDIASSGSAGVARLLASIEAGKKLLHLAGEDRVELGELPHEITPLAVYRSAALPVPEDLHQVGGAVVAVHSPRAGERLAILADERKLDRSSIAIAAISRATADCIGQGWEQVRVAEKPDDPALLALAKELCDKPPQE